MPSLNEVIARAEQIAVGKGIDPHNSPVIDGGLTFEALYPHALRYVIQKGLKDGSIHVQDLFQSHFIEMVDDVGVLPDTVMKEHLCHSFLPGNKFGTWVPYMDYHRPRFAALQYFAIKGDNIYFDGLPAVITAAGEFECSLNSNIITSSVADIVTAAMVGQRLQLDLQSSPGGVDAIITQIDGPTQFRVAARATAGTGLGVAEPGTVFSTANDVKDRDLTGLTTTINSELVTGPAATFVPADAGRRLRVMDGSTLVVDAIIAAVNSATQVELKGQAMSSVAGTATGPVYYTALELAAVTAPEPTDATSDLDISEKLADDVIITLAAVMTNEIPVGVLIAVKK